MASSKEVFDLRRSGRLDEAYAMALTVLQFDPQDEWSIKAMAWCLYDLIKRSVDQNDNEAAAKYSDVLIKMPTDNFDDVLFKSLNHVLKLANPEKRIIIEANQLSFNGREEEALILFQKAYQKFPND
jgi:tetratricopeptide (TPR) repeat protein